MKSLNKVLDILEVFLNIGNTEIRLSELAKLSHLNKATVYHIVSVLVDRGYLTQMERRGKYSLGTKFLGFSTAIKRKSKIRDIALPHLTELNKSIREPVSVFSWDGERMLFVDEVHSVYPLRISPDPGAILPLYCTAVGKIALSSMTEKELEDYYHNTQITAHTHNTITDLDRLKEHLKIVSREGVAFDDEELFAGIKTIAAGIRDAEEKLVGCVGIMGRSVRLTKPRLKKIAPEVKHCAMEISLDLGYFNR